jgi:3-oxoadipate enol-lactonase
MPFVTREGVRVHWDERGSGTPVLLVMGATYSSKMWYPVIDPLAQKHRVIWYDNRGTGQSESSEVQSIEDMAADACAVLDAAGVDRAHVYGVSLGGVITIQLALQSPERISALVLGCTGILSSSKPRAPKWLMAALIRAPWLVKALTGRGSYGPAAKPEAVARDKAALAEESSTRIGLRAQQDALRGYSVEPVTVATITAPTLVLHGDRDTTVKLAWGEELAATIPGAQLIRYAGCAHNYLIGAGDQANADVLAFLAEVDARVG